MSTIGLRSRRTEEAILNLSNAENEKIKHQLVIHLDYTPCDGRLEVRYSYPFSKPHAINEKVVTISGAKLPQKLKQDLDTLVVALRDRISTKPVRLPHAEVTPRIVPTTTTILIQDQRRSQEIPHSRMYYLEIVDKIDSRIEREIHMKPDDFTKDERSAWDRVKSSAKGIAWEDYRTRMGNRLRKP